MQKFIEQAIALHQLPGDFAQIVSKWYQPIAFDVGEQTKTTNSTLILGVQGTQGSGKSTLADFLRLLLEEEHQLKTVALSIDDFYLTRQERLSLAKNTHPLFATRGVPGTHDVSLATSILDKLSALKEGESLAIPRFNKAIDDRAAPTEWDKVSGPVDVIIFEGWCVAIPPQDEKALTSPVNELEAHEDPDGSWRNYVNDQLASTYKDLFNKLNALVVLTAPSFDCVYQWRLLQEQKLKVKWEAENPGVSTKIQTPEQIKRFISHYQRLTEHALTSLPMLADWQLILAENHDITTLNNNTKG